MIWSVFPVTGAEHAAFPASPGQQCGRAVLATESEFATHCAKCYLYRGRKGSKSTKGGSFNLFSRLVILTYKQHRTLFQENISLQFFFLLVQKGIEEVFGFFLSFCFKLFPFPFNSEWSVLRWHWFEYEWSWTRWPLEVSNLTLQFSTIMLLFWIPSDSKLPEREKKKNKQPTTI